MSSLRPEPTAEREVTLSREFIAPRDLVFRMWTDAAHLAKWWGPHGFTNPRCEVDARVGGTMRIDMRSPDGIIYPMSATFREIAAPERLVFVAVAEDNLGNPHLESVTTVMFTEEGGKTRVTVHAKAVGFSSAAPRMLAGMDIGWTQSLERLEKNLSGSNA